MEKKLVIGFFTDVFFPMIDGVVNVVDNYAKTLSKTAEVYVIAPDYGKIENINCFPYKVIRTKSIKIHKLDYRISFPGFDAFFRKNIKDIKFDIVHIHSPFAVGNYGISYAKKNNIPVVATLHSQYKKDFYEHTKNKFISDMATTELMRRFNKCDRLIAVNDEVAKVFYEYGTERMPSVLHNATDLLPLADEQHSNDLRKKHQIQIEHIENLTSFNNYKSTGLVVYLGGFSNHIMKKFLIKAIDSKAELYHFGDIDYGGFLILLDIYNYSGVLPKTIKMDIVSLKEKKEYCKDISTDIEYRRKLTSLLEKSPLSEHFETIKYMLENNVILEQEALDD